MVEHILTAAVHGLMLCHARNAEAVRAFVAATRYPFDRQELNGAVMVTHGTSVELTTSTFPRQSLPSRPLLA